MQTLNVGQIWLTENELFWFKLTDVGASSSSFGNSIIRCLFQYVVCSDFYRTDYAHYNACPVGEAQTPLNWRTHEAVYFKYNNSTDSWNVQENQNMRAGCDLRYLIYNPLN